MQRQRAFRLCPRESAPLLLLCCAAAAVLVLLLLQLLLLRRGTELGLSALQFCLALGNKRSESNSAFSTRIDVSRMSCYIKQQRRQNEKVHCTHLIQLCLPLAVLCQQRVLARSGHR